MLFEQVHAPMDGSCMQLCCHTLLSLSLGGERPLSFVCRGSSAAAVRCRKGLLCLAVHAVLVRVSRVQPAYFHIGTWCAQVTNPPIDPLREGLVMSLAMRLGKRGNLLQPGPGAYTQLLLNSPVLLESELEAIKTGCALSSKVPAGSASAPSPATFLGPWHWSPQALAGILVPADAKACRGQPVLDGTSTHDLLLSALLCGVGATVQRQVVMYQGVLTPVAAVSSARRPSTCTTPAGTPGALQEALVSLCHEVEAAVDAGTEIVILSDRLCADEEPQLERPPIPALLAVGAVHHHLIKCGACFSLFDWPCALNLAAS